MKWKCIYCGKKREDMPSIAKRRKYCSTSCQLKYEYDNGIRDKYDIGVEARKVSHERMKEDNWLNYPEARDNLRKVMCTEEYRKRSSESKLGDKNPMYGKKPGNYIDGEYRKWGNAYRGFDWKNVKRKIKERDGYVCQDCGVKETPENYLQVHHIVPYRVFQDNSDDNLITLCAKCHASHEYKFFKVKKITQVPKKVQVYNLSVDEDESYVANDVIVHNCRSVVFFEVED